MTVDTSYNTPTEDWERFVLLISEYYVVKKGVEDLK